MNPLEEFEKSFLKECIVLNKKFIFNLSSNLKSLNKVDILCDCLVSVDDINLENFTSIQQSMSNGLSFKQAKKIEIESWDPEIINILVNKFVNFIKNKKPIDFKKLPNLRIYWKLRKIFSKEELNNFSSIAWDWAIWNLQEDFKEKDEFDNRNLEKRKIWMNLDLFKHFNKVEEQKKSEEQENKLLIQKLMEKQGIDSNNYEIELVEDEDIPTVIEEK